MRQTLQPLTERVGRVPEEPVPAEAGRDPILCSSRVLAYVVAQVELGYEALMNESQNLVHALARAIPASSPEDARREANRRYFKVS